MLIGIKYVAHQIAGKKKPAKNAGKQQVEGSNPGNYVLLNLVLSRKSKTM